MEVLKMDEPISKNVLTSNNSRSLNSSFKTNKTDQASEIDKLRKQLLFAQTDNLNLQKELSNNVKVEAENKEKIVELTKKLREFEKKHEDLNANKSPRIIKTKEIKLEEVIALEQKVRTLENKNNSLEEKLSGLGETSKENEEKEIIIHQQKEKIKELEERIKNNEKSSNVQGDTSFSKREIEFQKVMLEYEEFIRKILSERQSIIDEKNTVQNHLANLELAFNDLLEKYERAKKIVEGFKQNEDVLRKQMEEWSKMLNVFDKKYTDLRAYAEKKISQANVTIMNRDKGNIEEVAKLKAKILQSQVKISELEKHFKSGGEVPNVSLFAPLKNNLKKKTVY